MVGCYALQVTIRLCVSKPRVWGYQDETDSFSCVASLPAITLRAMLLAMISELFGSFARACCNAASASSSRPRWISATAWETRLWVDDVAGACASSSKT